MMRRHAWLLSVLLLVQCGNPTQPPAPARPPPIETLHAALREPDEATARLTWTVPDAGGGTRPAQYEIRFSTQPLQQSEWDTVLPVQVVIASHDVGAEETVVVAGLRVGWPYYFVIRFLGRGNQWSPWSDAVSVLTRNNPPVAAFTVHPAFDCVPGTITVDASSSSDPESALEDLQFRWDWDRDGVWDTAWLTTPEATHMVQDSDTGIRLQVRDPSGAAADTTGSISPGWTELVSALRKTTAEIEVYYCPDPPWCRFSGYYHQTATGRKEGPGEWNQCVGIGDACVTQTSLISSDLFSYATSSSQGRNLVTGWGSSFDVVFRVCTPLRFRLNGSLPCGGSFRLDGPAGPVTGGSTCDVADEGVLAPGEYHCTARNAGNFRLEFGPATVQQP